MKLCGYTFAATIFSHWYGPPRPNVYRVGAMRTLIGMAAGALYFFGTFGFLRHWNPAFGDGLRLYLAGLIPIRLCEWWLLVWLFFDRPLRRRRLDWQVVIIGTIWSYVCDLPAIYGFLVTGGFWVC